MQNSAFARFFTLLNRIYKQSITHRIFVSIGSCYSNSRFGQMIGRYLDRDTSIATSKVVKFFSNTWTRLTYALRKFNRKVAMIFKNGFIYKIFATYVDEGKKNLSNLVSYPLVGFLIGFYGYISVKNKLYKKNLFSIVFIAVVVFVGVKYRKEITKWVKDSTAARIVKYFWE